MNKLFLRRINKKIVNIIFQISCLFDIKIRIKIYIILLTSILVVLGG